jgi:hypothetical protein
VAYEFNQGFLRAWENNRELVGGSYPAESDDWGFRDGSSITQLFTQNGMLQWVDLVRGGQYIIFTHFGTWKRYVLQDPPDNRLVEVWIPERQDTHTGKPIGHDHHDTPSDQQEQPKPPTPPKPPSPPETGNSYEGLEQIRVAVIGRGPDDISRAIDKTSGRQVWLLFEGHFEDRRGRVFPPNVRVRMVNGLVRRTGDREGTLWRVQNDCRNLAIDDNMSYGPYSQIPTALEVGREGVTVNGLTVRNHLGMGFTVNSPDVTLRNLSIYGPGGTGCVGSDYGAASWGAMWSGDNATRLHIDGLYATGEGGGCVFTEGSDFLIENVRGDNNCVGFTRDMNNPSQMYGGGQVCISRKARGGLLRKLEISSEGSNWASGLELDGSGTTVEDAKVWGHRLRHGGVVQHGVGNRLVRVEAWGNRVGCSVEPEASETVIDRSCNFHDNVERNLDDRGVNTRR